VTVSASTPRRDQRRHTRQRAGLAVRMTVRGGPEIPGDMWFDAENLSEGGAFLQASLLFEPGEILHLEIPLPSGKTVRIQGKVVRVSHGPTNATAHQAGGRQENQAAGMGIQFTTLDDDDRRILSATLKSLTGNPL